jgi:predicted permease
MSDLRFAIRSLARTPGFTLTALAALALGIGANTAIFSVIDAVLLQPAAWPEASRIVLFLAESPKGPVYGASATKFNAWRRQDAVQDVSAYEYRGANYLLDGRASEQVHAIRVSSSYFHVLGAPILLGRGFTPEEDRLGGARVAILTHGLWQRSFGGDPGILSRTITLSGTPYAVVGILGPDFETRIAPAPELFLPFQIDPNSTDNAQFFTVIGRLRPGMRIEEAAARLQPAGEAFHRQYPQVFGPGDRFALQSYPESLVSDLRPSLLVLAAAVALVLLAACSNVANLLLARANGRRQEIGIRIALGASRGRIVRQLLTESMLLSTAGGILGLALGLGGVRALLLLLPDGHGYRAVFDWRVAAFTIAVAILSGLLFGLFPALRTSRVELKKQRHGTTRALLVVGETAAALILLTGAALLIRTFLELRFVAPGFDTHAVLTLRTSVDFRPDTLRRIEGLPGVERAAASYTLPLEGAFGIPFQVLRPGANPTGYDGRGWTGASSGYFDVLRIPVLLGRTFTDRDAAGSPPIAVINQALSRQFFADRSPLGARILLGHGYGPEFEEPAREIVGVVGDVHDSGLHERPAPMVYVPLEQVPAGITALVGRAASLAWLVRSRVPPLALSRSVADELRAAGLPVTQVRSMDQVSKQTTAPESFRMALLCCFGAVALLLAALGIYGVMAYTVEQRTREIGVRLAIGADAGQIRALLLREGMGLALGGILVGFAGALALARFLAGFLFTVKPWDPLTFCMVPLVLTATSLLASWIPARRASRIEPSDALRGA